MNARSLILHTCLSRQLVELTSLHTTIDWSERQIMSHTQYLKMLDREIQRINKKIDVKIFQGQDYRKEARDHRLLLQKVRFHTRKGMMSRFFNLFFRKDIFKSHLKGHSYA